MKIDENIFGQDFELIAESETGWNYENKFSNYLQQLDFLEDIIFQASRVNTNTVVNTNTAETKLSDEVDDLKTPDRSFCAQINFCDEIKNYTKTTNFTLLQINSSSFENDIELFLGTGKTFAEKVRATNPELVLSVLGCRDGAVVMQDDVHASRFKSGFNLAATSINSLILTSGGRGGVDGFACEQLRDQLLMQYVGSREHRCTLAGVCDLQDVDQGRRIQDWALDCAIQSTDEGPVFNYNSVKSNAASSNSRQICLNSLLDELIVLSHGNPDQKSYKKQPENLSDKFRFELEKHLHQKCPVVYVLIGGETEILQRAKMALDESMPLVLCTDTGGISDVISSALKSSAKTWQRHKIFTNYHSRRLEAQIRTLISRETKASELKNDDQIKELVDVCLENLIAICKKRPLVVQWNFHYQDSKLETSILKAIFSSTEHRKNKLNLALSWNQCDDNVKTIVDSYESVLEIKGIRNLIFDAINCEKLEFVQLFLDHGLIMPRFLKPSILHALYQKSIKQFRPFERLMKRACGSNKTGYNLDDIYHAVEFYTSAKPRDAAFRKPSSHSDNSYPKTNKTSISEQNACFQNPFRELALWAVFSNKPNSVKFYWQKSENLLVFCLVISELWKALSSVLSLELKELEQNMLENERAYNKIALEILNECWHENKQLCQNLLELKDDTVGNRTPVDIAGYCEAKQFIAAPSVQFIIDEQWKNGMQGSSWSILSTLALPFRMKYLKLSNNYHDLDKEFHSDKLLDLDRLENTICMANQDSPADQFNFLDTEDETNFDKSELKEKTETNSTEFDLFMVKAQTLWSAPITKFVTHSIAYLLFLFLSSKIYIRIEDVGNDQGAWIQFCFMLCYALEIFRQLLTEDASWNLKVKLWTKSEWNIVDLSYLSLGIFAFISNFVPGTFDVVKGVYSLVIFLMWLRLLRLYQCNPRCGPIWCMIRRMLVHTAILFASFFSVIIIGSGLAMALFSIDAVGEGDYTSYQWIFLRPYLMIFGEHFIENVSQGRNAKLTTIFIVVFSFVVNALLLNLLIAVYGSIYYEIKENSKLEWMTEKFWLLVDYQKKTLIPPPLGIFETTFKLVQFLMSKRKRNEKQHYSTELRNLRKFENFCTKKALKKLQNMESKTEQKLEQLIKIEKNQSNQITECTTLLQECRLTLEEKRRENLEQEMNLKQIKSSILTTQAANKFQSKLKSKKFAKQDESPPI